MQYDVHDDIVQHQGAYHFAGIQLHFDNCGNQHCQTADNRPRQYADRRMQARAHGYVNRYQAADKTAQHGRAFARKVELVRGKHYAYAKARKYDRRHAP